MRLEKSCSQQAPQTLLGRGKYETWSLKLVSLIISLFCRPRDEHRAQDVTESFMELRSMLQNQVRSSEASVHNLVASSSKISSTKIEMQAVGAAAKTSGALISKFERREMTDKVLIGACLLLYFGVVLYIIQKRLLWWLW